MTGAEGEAAAGPGPAMRRREVLIGPAALGVTLLAGPAACAAPEEEPWADGTWWADGTGWIEERAWWRW